MEAQNTSRDTSQVPEAMEQNKSHDSSETFPGSSQLEATANHSTVTMENQLSESMLGAEPALNEKDHIDF